MHLSICHVYGMSLLLPLPLLLLLLLCDAVKIKSRLRHMCLPLVLRQVPRRTWGTVLACDRF